MKCRIIKPYEDDCQTILFKCISDKIANYQKDKLYLGVGVKKGTDPNHKVYTDYRCIDEDQDLFTIDRRDIGRVFVVVRKI